MGGQDILVVGCGGLGAKALAKLMDDSPSAARITAVAFDTDPLDLQMSGLPARSCMAAHYGQSVADIFAMIEQGGQTPADRLEALQPLKQFGRIEGTWQRRDVGLLLFEANRARFARALEDQIRSVTPAARTIILVGSLCGGTGSAFVPSFGQLLGAMPGLSDTASKVLVHTVEAECFKAEVPRSHLDGLRSNESAALEDLARLNIAPQDIQTVRLEGPVVDVQTAQAQLVDGIRQQIALLSPPA